ncbi:CD177 antigen isoform X3 [Eumetopias jubatus]|uniref:CD177 antigen isoform X3 n=1 Tax=Eumetopias jubatus TaxID=34886 RepID=UPI0010164A0B|nr:CD177 antigen isoform X3 [Eumetopias jubatus]
MSPALRLALLGATLMLPRVQALICQRGTDNSLRNVSELPLEWTTGVEECEDGWGCQDTLILIENGPQVYVVINKGCTPVADQDVLIREHSAGPGLTVLSYTRVCREKDKCNSMSTSLPLWTLPSTAGPSSLRCPVCLSTEDCKSATELTCPAGSTHCYRGAIRLREGDSFSILRVQGCTSQAGCNLLNGIQKIGPIEMREDCSPGATGFPDGCNLRERQLSKVTAIFSWRGCKKGGAIEQDGCNGASNTNVLLNSLPRPAAPAPGNLQCPICVNIFGSCPENPKTIICPNGTTHCYSGYIKIQGGGIHSELNIQGCVTQASSSLLNDARKIGVFSVIETSEEELEDLILQAGAAPVPLLAWVVGLGLSLAVWCGMPLC